MATLTIRNVPDELYATLKKQAAESRRSLNQEVIERLRLGIVARSPEDRRRAFERAREFADSLGRRFDHREVDAMIEEGRK